MTLYLHLQTYLIIIHAWMKLEYLLAKFTIALMLSAKKWVTFDDLLNTWSILKDCRTFSSIILLNHDISVHICTMELWNCKEKLHK